MTKAIYLDYAAATPLEKQVLAAMEPYFTENFHNPSAGYLAARRSRQALQDARAYVAGYLGAKPSEIVFTAGGTEANNLAIQGVMRRFPDGELLVSSLEHNSILAPAELFKSKQIPATTKGVVDLAAMARLITERTVLISVAWVNSELGTLQPLKEIARLVEKIRRQRLKMGQTLPLYIHTDAAQAAAYFEPKVARLRIDLMSINGGKIYGPKQSGALYVRAGTLLKPLILGGGQESSYRSGTENVAGCVGLAKALEIVQVRREAESKRLTDLRDLFIFGLQKQVRGALITGVGAPRAPHIVHVSFAGADGERLMMQLDELGIQCSVGSACSASRDEPSHVLLAIGMDETTARSSLRFSLGQSSKKGDILKTVKALKKLVLTS